MLTELCGYLKNWFVESMRTGDFKITESVITYADGTGLPLQEGQYFRIIGSVFNDGVYQYLTANTGAEGEDGSLSNPTLKDEEFSGTIWAMAVPPEVLKIAEEIAAWKAKYETTDSPALSPYNSESFGGYSYSKSAGYSSNAANGANWQSVFGNKLNRYRKV